MHKKYSLNISLAIAVIFLIVCAVVAFLLPSYINSLVVSEENGSSAVPGGERISVFITLLMLPLIYAFAYMLLGVGALIDILFINLLLLVRKGLIFTKQSTDLLRGISFCFLGTAILFFPIVITEVVNSISQGFDAFGAVSGTIFVVSLFLGLCIRVIKNVLEEAIAIKNENDMTI